MLPPLTKEEYESIIPEWAKVLNELKIPHVVGLPVYDVLHGGKYGFGRGVVASVKVWASNWSPHGIGVRAPDGSSSGAAGVYYVADLLTPQGMEHVRRHHAGQPLLPFPFPDWYKPNHEF